MATVSNRAIAALALALGLSACVEDGSVTPYARNLAPMGEALKYDMAAQTIDPDPIYPAGAAEPGTNGDAARAAAERYRKGSVKAVTTVSTTEGTGGGGSSGSR